MPHVSKFKLKPKAKSDCANLLNELTSNSTNKQPLLLDLLTDVELTMLAK